MTCGFLNIQPGKCKQFLVTICIFEKKSVESFSYWYDFLLFCLAYKLSRKFLSLFVIVLKNKVWTEDDEILWVCLIWGNLLFWILTILECCLSSTFLISVWHIYLSLEIVVAFWFFFWFLFWIYCVNLVQ